MQSLIVLASLVSELAGRVKTSGRSSPWKKIYIFEILVERAINFANFVYLKNMKI